MAKVMTVNGPISPDELGITLCHVHLLCHLTVAEQKQNPAMMNTTEHVLRDKPVSIEYLGLIRRHQFEACSNDNQLLGDVDEATSELMFFKRMGGGSVVEATPIGIKRDPAGLRQIASATGVNVICVTGWYISASHPAFVNQSGISELSDYMVGELTRGIGTTGIRAGVIKVALSGSAVDVPFTGSEEKVLRAAARAQARTGAAMTLHPCHHYGRAKHYHTYLDIIKEEGGNLEKCYLSHIEFWAADFDYQKSMLDRGATLAFDQFGSEEYARPGWPKPSDKERVEAVVKLVKAGYADKVMLSNEVVCKSRLRRYGGYGYAHVLESIVFDLKYHGLTDEQITTMLVKNPKRLLPF